MRWYDIGPAHHSLSLGELGFATSRWKRAGEIRLLASGQASAMLGLRYPICKLGNPIRRSLRTPLGLGPDLAPLRPVHSNSSKDTLLRSEGAEMLPLVFQRG